MYSDNFLIKMFILSQACFYDIRLFFLTVKPSHQFYIVYRKGGRGVYNDMAGHFVIITFVFIDFRVNDVGVTISIFRKEIFGFYFKYNPYVIL